MALIIVYSTQTDSIIKTCLVGVQYVQHCSLGRRHWQIKLTSKNQQLTSYLTITNPGM